MMYISRLVPRRSMELLSKGRRGVVATRGRTEKPVDAPQGLPIAKAPVQLGMFRQDVKLEGITIVATVKDAKRAIAVLKKWPGRPHAWDTETADVTVGRQSPVTHGRAICATCYVGDDVDFGNGPRLFIDNSGTAEGILVYFKDYFENPKFQKIFHNYSFDRHILKRHGIIMNGFHADTMHLARMYDTSLSGWEGVVQTKMAAATQESSEAARPPLELVRPDPSPQKKLSIPTNAKPNLRIGGKTFNGEAQSRLHTLASAIGGSKRLANALCTERQEVIKSPILFGPKLGYGLKPLSSMLDLSDGRNSQFGETFGVHSTAAMEAHNSPERFPAFAEYSTNDAVLTYRLYQRLKKELSDREWHTPVHECPIHEVMKSRSLVQDMLKKGNTVRYTQQHSTGHSMWNLAETYIRDLGQCLVELEETGVRLDRDTMAKTEARAMDETDSLLREFTETLGAIRDPDGELICLDADLVNPQSSTQLRTLLFGGASILNSDATVDKKKELIVGSKKDGQRAGQLGSLGLQPSSLRKNVSPISGQPKCSKDVLQDLAGDPEIGKKGTAYDQLIKKGYAEKNAELACRMLAALANLSHTKRILSNLIKPLQECSAASGRIHPQWKFDTATGRLVCRSPNLQNLPQSSQDRFAIRATFIPEPGNVFIIADYAQLELVVLAHMANCSSMIGKLSGDGDYHSEVAAEMFPEIRAALQSGEVVLSASDATPDVPTVKDRFSRFRTQAKAINFGIIYGKTSPSLAEDLGIAKKDAQKLMDAWFDSKPGVKRWMQDYRTSAWSDKRAVSLLGRWRNMPLLNDDVLLKFSRKAERAALNFGVQGSAADIVMVAMLRLWKDQQLQSLGFRLVMQIHDEFVLEGPTGGADVALERVKEVMVNPFAERNPAFKMRVPLKVDAAVSNSFAEKP